MPRQPFAPISLQFPKGHIEIGVSAIGQRTELEALIGNCLMAWPIAEAEMSLVFGQLLGTQNAAALAVFLSLRRASGQRAVISVAAEKTLGEEDRELLTAMLIVHKSIEAENGLIARPFWYIR